MDTVFLIGLSSIIASLFLITLMFSFTWKGFFHGEVIASLGSNFTKNPRKDFSRGLITYFILGLALAPLYQLLINVLSFDSLLVSMGFSMFIGISIGFVFVKFFIEERMHHHPNNILVKYWIPVSVIQWFGQVAYGVAVGTLIASHKLYGWAGLHIAVLCELLLATIVCLFAWRGAHKAALSSPSKQITFK